MIEARTAGPGSKSFRIDQTGIAMPEALFRRVWEIRPNRDEAIVPLMPRNGGRHHIGFITVALLALGLGWVCESTAFGSKLRLRSCLSFICRNRSAVHVTSSRSITTEHV